MNATTYFHITEYEWIYYCFHVIYVLLNKLQVLLRLPENFCCCKDTPKSLQKELKEFTVLFLLS